MITITIYSCDGKPIVGAKIEFSQREQYITNEKGEVCYHGSNVMQTFHITHNKRSKSYKRILDSDCKFCF